MTEEDDIDGLAAEYVLGSLDARERADVEVRRSADTSLRAAIEAWERRLAPLSHALPGVSPPPDLFRRILARMPDQAGQARRPAPITALHNRRHLPRVAVAAGAVAACLALAAAGWFLYRDQHRPRTHAELAAMDCGALYKDFWGRIDRGKYANISAEQLAGVSRMALRAYDACQAGDEPDAGVLFGRLRRLQF